MSCSLRRFEQLGQERALLGFERANLDQTLGDLLLRRAAVDGQLLQPGDRPAA